MKTRQLVGATTTNAQGRYEFTNLPPSDYVVEIVDRNGAIVAVTHSPKRVRKTRQALGICGLAGFSSNPNPNLSVTEIGFDSNVLNTAEDPKKDFTFTVTPDVTTTVPLGEVRAVTLWVTGEEREAFEGGMRAPWPRPPSSLAK